MAPYEIQDFSGGLTDNFFDSGPTRYKAADNMYITVDRKLEMREGSIPFDDVNYLIPGPTRRIDQLMTMVNFSRLLINQGRDVFALPDVASPTWTKILGPTGNEALSAGATYHVLTYGEFQRQLYVASSSLGLASKIFRDENNQETSRTVGLPKVENLSFYDQVTLLSKCIVNANALRTSMVAHINDVGGGLQTTPSATNLHYAVDKWSLSYFVAQVWFPFDIEFPGPVPVPTPAPNAVDEASLYALIGALNFAFTHHNTLGLQYYHYTATLQFGGLNPGNTFAKFAPIAQVSNNTVPNDLLTAATMLDDLYQKWYWHELAANLHGEGTVNNYALMNQYIVAQSKVGVVSFDPISGLFLKEAPTITPNYQDFYNYVNGLIVLHNGHIGGGGGVQGSTYYPLIVSNNSQDHTQPDTFNFCRLPFVTTIDEAYLAIAWIRLLYADQHLLDSNNQSVTVITFDSTAASPNITNVTETAGGTPYTLPVGSWIFVEPIGSAFFTAPPGTENVALVIASGLGTATLDRNVVANNVALLSSSSSMWFHTHRVGGVIVDGVTPTPTDELLATGVNALGTDLISWNTLALEYTTALFSHLIDSVKHNATSYPGNAISQFSPGITAQIPQWFVPTVSTLSYAFTYFYQYRVEPNGLLYQNESAPTFSESVQTIETFYPDYEVPTIDINFYANTRIYQPNPISISRIPALSNSTLTNYDTANIDVRIYRTITGGTTYYLLDQIDNGTTTYSDITNGQVATPGEDTLSSRQTLYTTGGVVANDQPPPAKFIHILDGIAYYGNLLDTGQYFPNRILQALPNNPDSAPANFTDDLDDEVMGISSVKNTPIIFCRTSLYRLSGGFNRLGQGSISHESISDKIGCLGANSIVKTEIGVFFAGTDGFYYTDGFQLIPISIDLNQSYARFTQTESQRLRIKGTYDSINRRIWWTVQDNATDTDCNRCFIFYLAYGVKPSGIFTTAFNDGSLVPAAANPLHYQYWRPSAIIFFEGRLTRGDERGVLLKSDPYTTTDPKIDLTISADQWNTVAIPWKYASTATSFGTHFNRKYATKVNVTGPNVGNVNLEVRSISDNGRVIAPLAPISYTQNPWWNDPGFVWGNPACLWSYDGQLDFWRRFPSRTLRSNLRQIEIRPARIGVYRSQDYPQGAFAASDNITKIVTLSTPFGYTQLVWPIESVDYTISFDYDNYTEEFLVVSIDPLNPDQMTVSDPTNVLPTRAGNQWVLRGYKKKAHIKLSAYVIHFALLGDETSSYVKSVSSGENS